MNQLGCVELGIGSRTDVGRVRGNNEDKCGVLPALKLFIVSDGMGGQAHGEVASDLAVETIAQHCSEAPSDLPSHAQFRGSVVSEKTRRLADAVRLANSKIHQAALRNPLLRGMGATVVAAWLNNLQMSLAHVGDSRGYLFRSGALHQLTSDHTLVAEQIRTGLIKPEEAHLSRIQNVLLRALGAYEHVEVDTTECTLAKNDIVLLCTDGLTRMVTDREIAQALTESTDMQTNADRLIAMANERGGQDNISVVILHIASVC